MAESAKGLVAEFDSVDALVAAIGELRRLGYRELDAHLPFPSDEVVKALDPPKSKVPLLTLVGGLLGMALGYVVPWWTNAVDYPLNVGGRPDNALPAFVPLIFETGVLFAGTFAFFGMLFLCKLPRLWHPIMEVEGFHRTTTDRFWVSIESGDPKFDFDDTTGHLLRLEPIRVERYGGLP